ncbi:MAG: zinc-binding dehydrogenase, partial [Pseudomonadota bacterium]
DVDAGGWSGALTFPLIQGGDLCGEIVALGEGVTNFRVGQRVICPINQPRPTLETRVGFVALGSEYNGAFAQYCAVPSSDLYDVTAAPLSDIELAAIPCAFGTAMGLLNRAGVRADQRVLVTGASGGVGMAAVQLAKLMEAEVTGVTSPSKAEAVRAAGAATVLGRDERPPEDAFHAVIDLVAGPSWSSLIDALRPGGHYAVAGAIAGPIVQADLRRIYLRDITLHGCTYQPPEVFAKLVDLVNAGRVKPLISKTYPLRDIAKAQEDFVSKRFAGKLVLLPDGERT